jgi:endogenous inhibitor of DNA gyrase (YacG/DUF329 family)/G:T-mismatch repair DNA endonuclease (very short patch repair protein)
MKRNRIIVECAYCGRDDLERTPSEIARRKNQFCSPECSAAYRRNRITVNCANPECQKPIERKPSDVARSKTGKSYCDKKCQVADPEWRASVSTSITVMMADPERRAKQSAATTKHYTNNPVARAKASIAQSKRLANNRKFRSPIESTVEAFLVELGLVKGIDFFINKHFRSKDPSYVNGCFGMNVDFWIPALNLIIECNGTYWHLDPRIYDRSGTDPQLKSMTATQRADVRRYERKVRYLRSRGIRVLELWEQENPFAEELVWNIVAEVACLDEDWDSLEAVLVG